LTWINLQQGATRSPGLATAALQVHSRVSRPEWRENGHIAGSWRFRVIVSCCLILGRCRGYQQEGQEFEIETGAPPGGKADRVPEELIAGGLSVDSHPAIGGKRLLKAYRHQVAFMAVEVAKVIPVSAKP
jgi:hypothetical protein